MSILALATATILSLGSFSTGAAPHAAFGNMQYRADLSSPADVDYFQATLMAGEKIRAKVQRGRNSELEPLVDLENSVGQSMGINLKLSKGRAEGLRAQFPWRKLDRSGTYSVVVKSRHGTSGAYDADFEINRQVVKKDSGRGRLDQSARRFVHTFEGMEGAEFTFQVKWGRRDIPLRLVSLTDPDGQPVAGVADNMDDDGRKIQLKHLPLTGRLGTYTLTIEQDPNELPSGPGVVAVVDRTNYNFNSSVRSPDRPSVRRPMDLDTAEPQLARRTEPIPAASGTNIYLDGQGFSADRGVNVQIGGQDATVCCATPDRLEVTVPQGQVGTTSEVTVVNADTQTVSETAYLTFQEAAAPPPDDGSSTEPATPPSTGPSTFEWTEFTPSSDTRKIYVSSSSGSDANNGLSESTPFRTIAKGYSLLRDGYPDWLLLKRGDTWVTGVGIDGLGTDSGSIGYTFQKDGRSGTEPMLISSYGEGSRPFIKTSGAEIAIHALGGGSLNFVAFVGLNFKNFTRDPSDEGFVSTSGQSGVDIGACDNVLFEDCSFAFYSGGMNIRPTGPTNTLRDVRIRRCVVSDSYSTVSHCQGIFAKDVNGLLLEESAFIHNGWHETISGAEATVYNRNLYIKGCADVVMRGCIDADGSSGGAQLRLGGLAERNLFVRNPLSISIGHPENQSGLTTTATIRNNVILGGRNISSSGRAMGITIGTRVIDTNVYGNIIAHNALGTANVFGICFNHDEDESTSNVRVYENIIFDWAHNGDGTGLAFVNRPSLNNVSIFDNVIAQPTGGRILLSDNTLSGISFTDNQCYSTRSGDTWFRIGNSEYSLSTLGSAYSDIGITGSEPNYSDPDRTIETYMQSIGRIATVDAFLAEVRKQNRSDWDATLSSLAVINYVREGFDLQPLSE